MAGGPGVSTGFEREGPDVKTEERTTELDVVVDDAPLIAHGISVHYGGVRALADVHLRVEAGEIVGLIGGNGAGKTTFMDCVSGYVTPERGGTLTAFGSDVGRLAPELRPYLGIVRSFQNAFLYPQLSVDEALLVAMERHRPSGLVSSLLGSRSSRAAEAEKREWVDELVARLGLELYRSKRIGQLSTGTRRVVDLATTMAQRPKLILFDEPHDGTRAAGDRSVRPAGPLGARHAGLRGADHRARHAAHHVRGRPLVRPRDGTCDRRRDAARGHVRRPCDRVLPRLRRGGDPAIGHAIGPTIRLGITKGETETMTMTGANLIAGAESASGDVVFHSVDPRTGGRGATDFHEATPDEIARAAAAAAEAAPELARTPAPDIAALLHAIADGLDGAGEDLIALADSESALGETRLVGERARTTGQLRAFADLVRSGRHLEPVVDEATDARPDVRRMLVPIGPVAVFGASNFPLAFSVPGGDTASALAAGCPVIAKGHPSHPGTSELCARVIADAVQATGLPPGTFSLVQGASADVGRALVLAPEIAAVGFTGSERGRTCALRSRGDASVSANAVFAEMGSLNPVFVTSAALAARGSDIANALASSVLNGAGQFCTKPGLLFVADDGATSFVDTLARCDWWRAHARNRCSIRASANPSSRWWRRAPGGPGRRRGRAGRSRRARRHVDVTVAPRHRPRDLHRERAAA